MANQGTTLTQSGQQVQALLNKIDNLGPATQEQAGTLSAEDKAKLDGIETGADVSVNPDWNASSGKAQILNKPTIPTRLAQMDDDGMHRTVTDADKTNWNSKTSFSGNYNDLTNKPDLSQFITKSVNDLVYYYTKSESYTKTQIDSLIGAIQTMHYEVYPILPETGSGNVLYLIGPIGTGADKYEEYVYYNNQWRKIGETSIDLSNYVTTDALNTALSSYVTSTSLATTLADYVTDSELESALADVGSAFVAQYGTTTLSQIRTAALAGKALFALRSTMVFVFSGINDDDKWVFTKAGASGSVAAVFVDEYDTWTDGFVSLQDSSKRTDTLSGNENDSTKYLSTKGAATELAKKYEKPSGGIPAADIASGVIPTVPTISTNITTDANSDTKTASPKAVKTYADTKYTKPSGGIPASDLADGVVPTTASATVDSNSGTPSVSVSMSNGNLSFAFSNLKGDQGNTGSSVAYPYELVNNCTTNDATKGLSAAQGKALKDELNQLDLKQYGFYELIWNNLGAAAFWGEKPDIHFGPNTVIVNITLATGLSISNPLPIATLGESYTAQITPLPDYRMVSVTCVMGGVSQTVTDGLIEIEEVTSGIVIVATAEGLDDVATDGKTYRQIFETNNILGIPPGYDTGSLGSGMEISNGSPALTDQVYCTPGYSLHLPSGSPIAQTRTKSGVVNVNHKTYVAMMVRVDTAGGTGKIGFQIGTQTSAKSTTSTGFVRWATKITTGPSSAARVYLGVFDGSDIEGYVDSPVVVLESYFTTAPTTDQWAALYENYIAMKNH